MTAPLMKKATAKWLVVNTSLTFEQIAEFCDMHVLEVQGIADGEVAAGIMEMDPVAMGQLSAEEVKRCEADASASLVMNKSAIISSPSRKKGGRYTPVARRQDKPDAIAWLLKNYPDITDSQIIKLIGTTKSTIAALRNKTHWNMQHIKPRDPVLLGLCTQTDLNRLLSRLERAEGVKEA